MTEVKRVELTPDELTRLAKATTDGAFAIARVWDILNEIGQRIGKDWEPGGPMPASVSDIFDMFASGIDDPETNAAVTPEEISESEFTEEQNWQEPTSHEPAVTA